MKIYDTYTHIICTDTSFVTDQLNSQRVFLEKKFLYHSFQTWHTRLAKPFVDTWHHLRPPATVVLSTTISWCELKLRSLPQQRQVTLRKGKADLKGRENETIGVTVDSSEQHEFSAPFISQLLKWHKTFRYNKLNVFTENSHSQYSIF